MATYGIKHEEGASTNRPPLFNGANFTFWKSKMEVHIRSEDPRLWRVISTGNYQFVDAGGLLKTVDEMTDDEIKKTMFNYKAMKILHCARLPDQFAKVASLRSAKDI